MIFNLKKVVVSRLSQNMLNWLDDHNIEYTTQPHLVLASHSLMGGSKFSDTGKTEILFESEDDRLQFVLSWGDEIIK